MIKPRSRQQTSFDAKSHEAWIWGFTMDLPCFTRVREICHVGNIWKRRHSGTWHWELRAEQRGSKIEGGSTPISVCWYLNIFNNINNVLYDFHDRCLENLKTLLCATCTGCLHLGTRVVSAMIRRHTSISVPYNLTLTKPSVQLELLPVYCFLVSLRGCCVALSSVTTVHNFRLFWFFLMRKGLLHLGIHVFLESRLVTLNIWSPEPYGCVIQWFALHFMQLRQETKDFWTPIVGGFVWLWTWTTFF